MSCRESGRSTRPSGSPAGWTITARSSLSRFEPWPTISRGRGFIDAYVMMPDELEPLMAAIGFERRVLLGCEGVVSFIQDRVNELDAAWDAWVKPR